MLSNTVSLPSLPAVQGGSPLSSLTSLGSLSSLGSISFGLVCAANVAAGSALPIEVPQGDFARVTPQYEQGNHKMLDPKSHLHVREPQAGERADVDPTRGGAIGGQAQERQDLGGDSRTDGSLPKGPEPNKIGGGDTPGMRSPGQVITTCTVPGTAALTFDDGPYIYTEEVSRILKDNGAVGTFFFNGQNFGCINSPDNAARVKAVYDAGHQVASHTWSHKDLATLSQDEVISEMSSVTQSIQSIINVTPAFMRPPYGSYNDGVVEAAAQIGQDVVLWNLDSGDSANAPPSESKDRYNQAAQQKQPILALNHETHETSVNDVLPAAIQSLKDAGYRLVSVAECVGKEPYLKDPPSLPPSNLNCS